MNLKLWWIILIIVIVGLGVWWWLGGNSTTSNVLIGDNIDNVIENIDENLETATLSAVGNYTGTGMATRKFVNNIFVHTVSVTLPNPAAGKFYEGWLVIPTPLDFFSTGELKKDGDKWKLTYTSNEDKDAYLQVVITEETLANGLDGISETHILEGNF